MTILRSLPLAFLATLSIGCAGGAQVAPPNTAQDAQETPGEESSESASEEGAKDKGPPADVLYAPHEAIPPLAETCQPGTPLTAQTSCKEPREDLASALTLEGSERDAQLQKLEACDAFPAGLIRALRVELGDATCGDALVAPVVGEGKDASAIPGDIRETLVALGIGARLRRLAVDPPKAPKDHSKESLATYYGEVLFPWTTRQAQAIFVLAAQGTHLSGYARGVVAVEAGNADMRFVQIVRNAPLADEIAEHEDAKNDYYATLDERLEPRKARGRNAALVGLREMARLGVRSSPRVESARILLSRVYGGRRVDALDTLMVPPVSGVKPEGAAAAIASRVPAAYAASLVGPAELSPHLVRAHLQMGMPTGLRREIEASKDARSRFLLARALFESGRSYFRAQDFQDVQALLTPLLDDPDLNKKIDQFGADTSLLLRALAVALSAGPKDAAEMIAKGPRFADSLGNLVILDGLAEKPGELGGRAAFNAAYLRELVAPEGAPDYWADLGKRYLAASKKLKGDERNAAAERGKACLAIEKELRKQKKN